LIEKKREIGFSYDSFLSEYAYSFTVYSSMGVSVLICKIVCDDETGNLIINVYDRNNTTYVPFYQGDDRNEVIIEVEKRIRRELNRIGAKKLRKNPI
jgi:hypothetical protein